MKIINNSRIDPFWLPRHEESQHTLVLTDAVSQHKPAPGYETMPYRETEAQGEVTECIYDWASRGCGGSGAWAHTDFDFTNPQAVASRVPEGVLAAVAAKKLPHEHGGMEWFDYPGGYVKTDRGKELAAIRIEARQAALRMAGGNATARGLVMGGIFTLKDHPRADQNRDYLVTRLAIECTAGAFGSEPAGGGIRPEFRCQFSALDTRIPFRPAPLTASPRIHGPQTAIVTGPTEGQAKKEEEIYTDEYGRVKVHFHWDRHHGHDQDSSCWVRVAQAWAGQGWGALHIPRIGQEVVVEFLDGDPDRPIITGSVYNKHAQPPCALPDKKNVSGIRSKSNPGGAASENFNEILMDDTQGGELLSIQAEKDRRLLVKNDSTEEIKHDELIVIGHDRKEEVKHDGVLKVGENQTVEVGKTLRIKAGDEIVLETGQACITLKKSGTIEIKGTNISVGGKAVVTIKGGLVKVN